MAHGLLWLFEAIFVAIVALLLLSIVGGMSLYVLSNQVQAVLIIALIVAAVVTAFLLYKALQARFLKVKTGKEALIGSIGVAVTDLKPKGEVRVLSEFWQAEALSGWIERGAKVEVTNMEGLFLIVRTVNAKV